MAVLWSLSCLAPAQARADRVTPRKLKYDTTGGGCRASAHPCAQGLQRYIKKRQLDLLETYVPAVLSARDQLQVRCFHAEPA